MDTKYGALQGDARDSTESIVPNLVEYRSLSLVVGSFQLAMLVLFSLFVVYPATAAFEDVQYMFFLDVTVMMLVGFGYLMTFMRNFGLGAVGLTFLITTMCIQWGILSGRFFASLANNSDYPEITGKDQRWEPIALDVNALLNGDFAAAAVLISFGALIGKISPSQTALLAIIEVPIYAFNKEYLCIGSLSTLDMGGTIFIHLFGAYFGLAAAWVIGKPNSTDDAEPSTISDVFSLIGTVFLWVYWPSFNGATAPLGAAQQGLTTANTVMALCGSCVTTFVVSSWMNKRISTVDIQNATLAGGVCIGAASNLKIMPGSALAAGMLAGALSTFGFNKIQSFVEDRFNLHDSCGVHNLHGLPALLGAIICIIATKFDAARGDAVFVENQDLAQLYGTLVTLVVAIVTGLATGVILKKFGGNNPYMYKKKPFMDTLYWTVAHDKV